MYFGQITQSFFYAAHESSFLKHLIRREDIFESSYRAIFACPANLLHCRLYITFDKEIGIDYGGVAREWLYLLSKQMFSPDYGLFEYVTDDDYLLQLSPISSANPDHLNYFKVIYDILSKKVLPSSRSKV
jgi:E3 ubiquitin ligase SMURF1/2